MLTAIFKKKHSTTQYKLICSDNENIETTLTQFQLSLPLKENIDNIYIYSINNIELKPDETFSFKVFKKLILEAYIFIQNNKIISTPSNCIFVTNKSLSARKAKNRFKTKYIKYTLSNGFLYLLNKPQQVKSKNIHTLSTSNTIENEKTAIDYQDFDKLQKYAILLENKYKIKEKSFSDFKTLAQHALSENTKLTKKDEDSKTLQSWLKDNYANYLKSDIDKLTFIQNLIMAQNSSQVKQLTNNSSKNLLNIIKGVCDYK